MNIPDEVIKNVVEWRRYSQLHQYPANVGVSSCEEYRRLVNLGPSALIHLKSVADQIPEFGLVNLVREISDSLGIDFRVPPSLLSKPEQINPFVIQWIDDNYSRYCSAADLKQAGKV